jgi:hypothetical protein
MLSSSWIRFNSVDGAACEQFQSDFPLTDAVHMISTEIQLTWGVAIDFWGGVGGGVDPESLKSSFFACKYAHMRTC